MKSGIFASLIVASLILAGCNGPKERTALQITTRAGGSYLMVVAQVEYLQVCYEGKFDQFAGIDDRGLRAVAFDPDPKQKQWEDIRWSKIDSISFGAAAGNVGGFCEGLPEHVAAVISHSGEQQKRDLLDTTDEGIQGLSERGRITIAIRDITTLNKVPDQHWPWSVADTNRYDVSLHVTKYDHTVADLMNPEVAVPRDKKKSFETLMWPFSTADERALTVTGAGARLELPWNTLKTVEFDALQPGIEGHQKVWITFADGSRQEFGIPDGELHTSDATEPFEDLTRIEVQAKALPAPPKPSS